LNNGSTQTVKTDSKGNFTSPTTTIPFGIQNAHYTFNSSLTGSSLYLDIGIAPLNPGLILSAYYDVGGAPLTITGMGFGGNEKVSIRYDNQDLDNIITDSAGNFTFKTKVPYAATGSHTVVAAGQSSGASSSASFTQAQVYTNAQLGSYAGAPGAAVTFIGSGFLPNEPVEITTDRTGSVVIHNFTANSKGSFHDSGYILPANFTSGPLQITITGKYSQNPTIISYYVTGP
jgi:hypothetical protein